MPKSIFRYIFVHSWREQAMLFAATLVYLPLLYFTFELPKIIVNEAIGEEPDVFPKELFGVQFDHISFLLLLCGTFLTLVVVAGGFKYILSVYKGVLAEIMLRRLRYDLYTRVLRFPLDHLRKITGGEIVAMSTAETEQIGRYMGVAVANPALQGGTLLTALGFLFAQDIYLGAAALVLFPVQAYLVPKFQRKMNEQSRMRLTNMRLFAGHVSETIDGAKDIIAHNTMNYELAKTSARLGVLFRIRKRLYELGNTIIFLNNFFTQLTPFLFYAIGGYLVIEGELTIGALLAVIAAYREAAAPWNELLENYQQLEDNRVKYALLIDNFMPEGLRDLPADDDSGEQPEGTLEVEGALIRDGEETRLARVELSAALPTKIAFLGPPGSGVNELAELLAGLRRPDEGRVVIGEQDIGELPANVLGSFLSYVDSASHVFTGTWRDNLYYGLKHHPVMERQLEGENLKERIQLANEAAKAGNTTDDYYADWVNYQGAGVMGREDLEAEALSTIQLVNLEADLFEAGLRGRIDPREDAESGRKLLEARVDFRRALDANRDLAGVVQFLDEDSFNTSASVADNLLFGQARDNVYKSENLAEQPVAIKVLEEHDLLIPLVDAGREASQKMIEMFRDFPQGDERLSRFNLIQTDDRMIYEALLGRVADTPVMQLKEKDQNAFLKVAFRLTPMRHRLGLISDKMQARIVQARKAFRASLPEAHGDKIAFFDPSEINPYIGVYSNVLNGYMSPDKTQHKPAVDALIREAVDAAGLRDVVMCLGLDADVGNGGGRLSQPQRQKLAVARCLIKHPRVLIINEALNTLSGTEQQVILDRIMETCGAATIIWCDRERDGFDAFDDVFVVRGGRIVDHSGKKGATVEVHKEPDAESGGLTEEIQVLGQLPIFQGIETRILRLVAYTSQRREYAAGDELMVEGGMGTEAFVIIGGEAEILIGREARKSIGSVGPGSMVGEVALLMDIPRTATIRAASALSVLAIERTAFLEMVNKEPALGIAVSKHLAGRLAVTTEKLEQAADD